MLGSRAGSIAIFYSRMLRLLGGRGLVRQPWQTPLEYLQSARSKVGLRQALAPAETLTGLFIAARYCGAEVAEAQVLEARQAFLQFKQSLSRKPPSLGKTKA
jgi:hypothetical protein